MLGIELAGRWYGRRVAVLVLGPIGLLSGAAATSPTSANGLPLVDLVIDTGRVATSVWPPMARA